MGQGAQTVVKLIAPLAIDALAAAAQQLIAGPAYAERRSTLANAKTGERRRKRGMAPAVSDSGTTIADDTWQYVEANFASMFGYFYQGLNSQPALGGVPVAGGEDIIIWQTQNGLGDIKAYLQKEFQNSLNSQDSVLLSDNLSALFLDRFKETSLEWTPFFKRYNFPDKQTGTVIVDCYMVTSPATDASGNPAGVASFCYVAYNHNEAAAKPAVRQQKS